MILQVYSYWDKLILIGRLDMYDGWVTTVLYTVLWLTKGWFHVIPVLCS